MKKFILIVLGLVLLLFIGAATYVSMIDWNVHKNEIASRIENLTGKKVVFEGPLSMSLLPSPYLSASNVKVYNKEGTYSKKPLAEIKNMVAKLSLGSVMSGDFDVERMALSEPEINFELYAEGGLNWESDFTPEQEGNVRQLDISLDSVTLEKAKIHLVSKKNGIDATLENLNAMDEIDRHQYLTSQVAKYDIKEINIDGLIFPFENFRSAPTFKSIFAKLAELTGNADYYDSSGTPRHADQSPDPAPQSKPQAAVTSAENLSTTIEHNAQLNGLTGMWLRSEFTIHGMCRKKGWVVFYFYFEDGKALKDYNNSYATADGKVAAIVEFVPPYADGRINAAGFVPYSELHLASGHHKLAVYTAIFDDNQRELLRGDWLFFQVNQP